MPGHMNCFVLLSESVLSCICLKKSARFVRVWILSIYTMVSRRIALLMNLSFVNFGHNNSAAKEDLLSYLDLNFDYAGHCASV